MINSLLGTAYPERGDVLGILDTGYTGFILLPEATFDQLRLSELDIKKTPALSADGREVELLGAYGTVAFSEAGILVDGLVQTCEGASELLVGTDALRRIRVIMDFCREDVKIMPCT